MSGMKKILKLTRITGVGHAYLDFDYFDAVASDSVPTVQIDGVDLEEVVFLNRSKR